MQKQTYKADPKWIHFIGIGGVAMAPLAYALSQAGYQVTGSDRELYEPVKSYLAQRKLKINDGYDFSNLIDGDKVPGGVISAGGISLKNRELLFAKKQNLNLTHMAEAVGEFAVKKEASIVVAGTYGKTSITALLSWIFTESNIEASFMFGGFTSQEFEPVKLKSDLTQVSITEGDEYIAARWDKKSKFFYYSPKYLVLTSIRWDHTDVFKTEEEYIGNFKKLINLIPADGAIFANKEDENVMKVVEKAKCDVVLFDKASNSEWIARNSIQSALIGSFNLQNIAIAGRTAELMGVDASDIKKAVQKFKGIKRRLEVRHDRNNKVVVDDFASSPPKVQGTLSSVKEHFKDSYVVAIFHPNSGNRTQSSLNNYQNVFKLADEVVLPKFEELIKSDVYNLDEKQLNEFLSKEGVKSTTFETDDTLTKYLQAIAKDRQKVVFVYMSSIGMDDRIKELIEAL